MLLLVGSSTKEGKEGLLSLRNWPWTWFRVGWNQGRAKVDRATVYNRATKLVVPFSFIMYNLIDLLRDSPLNIERREIDHYFISNIFFIPRS